MTGKEKKAKGILPLPSEQTYSSLCHINQGHRALLMILQNAYQLKVVAFI